MVQRKEGETLANVVPTTRYIWKVKSTARVCSLRY